LTRIDWLPATRLPDLQAFVDERWRHGHVLARDAELLRWQHRRRGDPDSLAVLVAEEDGRMLAMLGWIDFDACVREERVRGGWMTNWLVVPEARGRRLGLALVEHVLGSEYELVGALAANAATRHVLGSYGFAEVEMRRWVRVLDVEALRELLAGRDVPDEAWDSWAEPPPPPRDPNPPSNSLLQSQGFVGACRDEAFVRRRYEEHPRFRYELLRDGGLAAYRIETVAGSDTRVMRVVDFLGDAALATTLVEAAGRAGAVFADFACTSARLGAPLQAAGFAREDRLPAALPGRFQPLDFSDRPLVSCFWAAPRLGQGLFGDDLYVTRADSDLDRPN
jgi:GNAT superfamily N-acetyltransferase